MAGGIRVGLCYAVGFSVIAAVIVASTASGVGRAGALREWITISSFYVAAGVAGGAVFGWLRPFQHLYWGRYLTAYLVLFLVYGGGTATVLPLLNEDPGPIPLLVAIWAVLCVILAPIYVQLSRKD